MLASFLGTEAPTGSGVVALPITPASASTAPALSYSESGTWLGNLQEYVAIHLTSPVITALVAVGFVLLLWLTFKRGKR
jgi:hypothetical protein